MTNKLYLIAAATTLLLLSCKTQKDLVSNKVLSITSTYEQEVVAFQEELNNNYGDPEKSPLDPEKIEQFTKDGGHKFFPIDANFRIEAQLDTSKIIKDVGFKTSTTRIAMYDRIGVVKIELNSRSYSLSIYESHYARAKPDYNNLLFLPFTDLTNGDSTYGGGRYMDVERQNSNTVIIDFNKTYNPYCAYSTKYSCPVPPQENFLYLEVKAGIRLEGKI